ncbi:hypothetical protein [Vitreimonas sp.]|uniref:hypothetical protein n=1 Tax=Vitreimonas sp. TaxID=3069702 RepID=UPI002ED800F8
MLIWTGWGIGVVIIAFIGLMIAFAAGDALMTQFAMPYGPANSAGIIIGGVLAAIGMVLLTRWREQGESRTFIDERTGERIEVRPNAGSLFFIPTRYWSWIMLALTALMAFFQFDAVGPTY